MDRKRALWSKEGTFLLHVYDHIHVFSSPIGVRTSSLFLDGNLHRWYRILILVLPIIYTDVCQHCGFSTFPSSVKKNPPRNRDYSTHYIRPFFCMSTNQCNKKDGFIKWNSIYKSVSLRRFNVCCCCCNEINGIKLRAAWIGILWRTDCVPNGSYGYGYDYG